MPKLMVIGLDCAEPSLIFDRWQDDLPVLSGLMQRGSYGKLESCIPAITVPAWSCMTSGRDPGELGIYGFRNRRDRSYDTMGVADGRAVKVPRLWNYLSDAGWTVAVLGVPGTYPPQPVNGTIVSGFLTPNVTADFTHPPGLGTQLRSWVERYLFDVPNFRSAEKDRILQDIYDLGNQNFALARRLLVEHDPDFFMMVDMGIDRLHHAFWKHMDPRHPLYVADSPFAEVIHDYYVHVDRCIGKLLDEFGSDTAVLIASDHGSQPLMGGFCFNEWLIDRGYLVLKGDKPTEPTQLNPQAIDWDRTKAWGAGGYYGRLFLNVAGREPQGTIPLTDYQRERDALIAELEAIPGPDGQPLGVKAHKPQDLYQRVRGIAPDLIVYFQDLAWRAIGSIGMGAHYCQENDTGPDDANHAQYGLFIFADPQHPQGGQTLNDAQIYDILPTMLARYGLDAPRQLRGKPLPI